MAKCKRQNLLVLKAKVIHVKYKYLGVLFFLFIVFSANSQNLNKLKISRLTNEIVFDGKIDEPAWLLIDTLPVTMHIPVFRGKLTERTIIRVAYDEQYLWIGARLLVNNPDDIMASSKKRDELNANSDFFGVVIDTYNDNENAMSFFTTPTGLRLDATISNDASTEEPLNPDWNTFWETKTTRDEYGWYTEMRIPFSSLRFQTKNGITEMGFICWRWSARSTQNITFPAIDPKYGMWATWKPSLAQKIVFENIKPSKPVYLAPYVLAGNTNSNQLNESETEYFNEQKPDFELGADLKYSLTSNLTMDLTLNTDFAQVEADDQQINLTRFSLFFPEKRMFFQERSSIFDFKLGGPNNLFYSRRIGIDNDGNPVRILGGARIYGRLGKWDVGLLNMQTAKSQELPSENFGVLRFRRQVINRNSYVGGIFTSRLGTNGNYNTAYGFDGIFRVFGDDYMDVKWAQTFENDVKNNTFSLKPTRMRVNWQRRTEKGLAYDISLSHSGSGFNPGAGFEIRDNYRAIRSQLQWGWLSDENSKLFSHAPLFELMNFYNSENGVMESGVYGVGWKFQTKKFLMGQFQLKRMFENVEEEFSFSDNVEVPIGKYSFYGFEGMMMTPMTRKFYTLLTLEGGQFYDGNRFSFTTGPFLNFSSSVVLSGTYQFDAINFNGRNQNFTNHIARVKLEYMYSTKFSASSFVQYNTLDAGFIGNFRLRYNPREGNDFYLVFNEMRNLKPELEIPRLPQLSNRTILLKYTHTFIL